MPENKTPEDKNNNEPTKKPVGILDGIANAFGAVAGVVGTAAGAVGSVVKMASEVPAMPGKMVGEVVDAAVSGIAKLGRSGSVEVASVASVTTLKSTKPEVAGSSQTKSDSADSPKQSVIQLPIKELQPNPMQPRKHFDQASLDELAASIAKNGILSPILSRRLPSGKFEIIDGERRYRAARKAGLKEVPIMVKEADDLLAFELALIENLQREDLNAVEEAAAYKVLKDRYAYSQDEIAAKVGKSRSHVGNALSILSLPQDVLDRVRAGEISAGHAKTLVGEKDVAKLADEIVRKKLSVRETEAMVRKPIGTNKQQRPASSADKSANEDAMAVALLGERFHAQVEVDTVKNDIVIHCKDSSTLQAMLKLFDKSS